MATRPSIVGDPTATALIDKELLRPGEGIIGTSEGRLGTNIAELVQSPPRPSGSSMAPRPAAFSGTIGRPSTRTAKDFFSPEQMARLESTGQKQAAERIAGPVSAREAKVAAIGEEERREEALLRKQQELADARAFEIEKLEKDPTIRVADIKAAADNFKVLTEAATAEQKDKTDRYKIDSEEKVELEKLRNELRIEVFGAEATAEQNALDRESEQAIESMKLKGAPTPREQALADSLVGIGETKDNLVSELGALNQDIVTATGETRKSLERSRDAIVRAFKTLSTQQSALNGALMTAEGERLGKFQNIAEGIEPASVNNAGFGIDANNDGNTNEDDIKEINNAIRFLNQYAAKEKAGNTRIQTDEKVQADKMRAEAIVKVYKKRLDQEAQTLVNGAQTGA